MYVVVTASAGCHVCAVPEFIVNISSQLYYWLKLVAIKLGILLGGHIFSCPVSLFWCYFVIFAGNSVMSVNGRMFVYLSGLN